MPPPADAPREVPTPPEPTADDATVPPPLPSPDDLPPIPPPSDPPPATSSAAATGAPPGAAVPPAPPPEAAVGSPDAPRIAGEVRPDQVPALVGLALNDAETQVRRAGMTLYVERVPGHPVGRVLHQEPPAGATTAPGIVVKVRVTAGGDAPGATAPPPVVDVQEVAVPDVMDRMPPQARRILEDVGLLIEEVAATSGPPGRVVDQLPMPGDLVPKGTVVRIRIAPGEARRPGPPAASPAPPPGEPPAGPPAATGRLVAPTPISPPAGTEIPGDATVALGFAWRVVPGAEGYVLEVEEMGTETWLPNVRRTSKSAAATIEVERLSGGSSPLRWRVRAVAGGREGPACPWVLLR